MGVFRRRHKDQPRPNLRHHRPSTQSRVAHQKHGNGQFDFRQRLHGEIHFDGENRALVGTLFGVPGLAVWTLMGRGWRARGVWAGWAASGIGLWERLMGGFE